MRDPLLKSLILGSAFLAPSAAAQAQKPAQPAAQPVTQSEDEDDVVVTGQRPRGSVLGDIPAENVLRSRDVKATGATSLDELLDAIAPQIAAARQPGGATPLVLLNGRRVSSYRELRDIPIEAISRIDILPPEVALKYGYAPSQKVVNVVLQKHFASTTAQVAGNTGSQHGFTGGSANLARNEVNENVRTALNAHVGSDDILSGAQRGLVQQQYDTHGTGDTGLILPSEFKLRGTATVTRELPGGVQATANAETTFEKDHSLSGLSEQLPAELNRDTTSEGLHLGGTLVGDLDTWHWNVSGNADVQHLDTRTDEKGQLFAPGSAKSTLTSANIDGTVNGSLFAMPAGDANVTLRAAGSTEHLSVSQDDQFETPPSDHTDRTTGTAGISLDLPVAHSGRALGFLGNLTLNGNAEVNQLSDFGTLTRIGAGTIWSPGSGLSLIGSWNREEQAPTVRQLGDPFLQTPETRIFDFTSGVVPRAAVITGGNPDLATERRNILDLTGTWQPFEKTDLTLRAGYTHESIDRPISAITVSPEIEAAFPDRFLRSPLGELLSVDLRPVNFDSARRDTVQLGLDFSKPLKSRRPSASQVQKVLDEARAAGMAVPSSGATATANSGVPQFSSNGRLTFSLTDTITTVDRATVGPGLPELDYLHGAAIGQTGGQPRHQVQAQAGWSNHGLGGRVGLNWRSGTDVETLTGDTLRFSPLATFDLRLFANVGQDIGIVAKHPWLAGSSVRFEVGNIFDTMPKVRTSDGSAPVGYDPSMLDPLGRTFMISLRKQFLPRSYYEQQLQRFEQRQNTSSPGQ